MRELYINFEKVANTLNTAVKNLGIKAPWPPRKGTNSAIFGPNLAEELLRITEELSLQELSAIRSPTLVWKLYLTSINGVRRANWPRKKREKLADNLLRIIPELKEDDYYYENDTNRLKNFKLEIKGTQVTSEEGRQLKVFLWMHQEALYYNFHNIGLEIHGPYEKDRKKYLVYDYCNFNPEIWEKELIDVDKIRIISEFEKLNVAIDAVGNYYGKGLANPERIWISPKKVSKESIEASMKELITVTSSFPSNKLFEKELEIVWYSLKPWKDKLRENWVPPIIGYSQEIASSFKIFDAAKFLDITQEI